MCSYINIELINNQDFLRKLALILFQTLSFNRIKEFPQKGEFILSYASVLHE